MRRLLLSGVIKRSAEETRKHRVLRTVADELSPSCQHGGNNSASTELTTPSTNGQSPIQLSPSPLVISQLVTDPHGDNLSPPRQREGNNSVSVDDRRTPLADWQPPTQLNPSPANPNAFFFNLVASKTSGINLAQLGWHGSDHQLCVISIPNVGKFFIWNMWMQGDIKIDNQGRRTYCGGHQSYESKEKYRERYLGQAKLLAKLLNENPDIIGGFLEEAVLGYDDQRAFFKRLNSHLNSDSPFKNFTKKTSSFGVSTILRSDKIGQAFFYDEELCAQLASSNLFNRCQIFNASDAVAIANIHNPFGAQSENALKEMLLKVLSKKINKSDCENIHIYFFGDFNLSPEKRIETLRCVFDVLVNGRKPEDVPFKMIIDGMSSPEGHQQTHRGEPILVNTDGCLSITIQRGINYALVTRTGEETIAPTIVFPHQNQSLSPSPFHR